MRPRAAAVRGDDYQHAIGWVWACRALNDPDIMSITIEDAGGGAFDDIVIRRRPGLETTYLQVKTSNYGSGVVDEQWLTTKVTPNGRSPLQHFHMTWKQLAVTGDPYELAVVTNRQYDHDDPLLGDLRDIKSQKINVDKLSVAGSRSNAGRARNRWSEHLGITEDELLAFLAGVEFQSAEAESSWDDRAKTLMQIGALRADDEAVTVGKAIARGWVADGAGPQTRDDIRRQVTGRNLLAREGTLVLAVHAIDDAPTPEQPNVSVNIVDLYDGADAFSRRRLRDPEDWSRRVVPALADAVRQLEAFRTRRVHVVGSMRLPMWFAVGRFLPDVRGWVLSLDQRGEEWSTGATPEPAEVRVLADEAHGVGDTVRLATAIALTHDPSEDVRRLLNRGGLAGHLLTLGPRGEPGQTAVPGADWAIAWVRAARQAARRRAAELGADHVHLFIAAPAGVALFLGHFWNLMPTTTVHEHIPASSYEPTFVFGG
jgi:CBASS immunity sensor of nucleotide second messenger signals